MAVEIKRTLRPGPEKIASNVWHNIRLGYPQVGFYFPQNTPIVLCAGGASLLKHLKEVRRLQLEEGGEVVALGNVAHTLMAEGIKVNGHIILDGSARNRSFVVSTKDTRYFIASQCDPGVFKAVKDHKYVFIWHCGVVADEKKDLDDYYGKGRWFAIKGGSYVTLRAISLLHVLGYKWMHVFGFDSCNYNGEHHAYFQPNADRQKGVTVKLAGKEFDCSFWQLDQAEQFYESVKNGRFGDAELNIYGDGLIAHMVRTGSAPTWQLQQQDSSSSANLNHTLAGA